MDERKRNPYLALIHDFEHGVLEQYDFIDQINKYNKALSYIAERIPNTNLSKIEITDNRLVFTTRMEDIKLYFSGRDRRGVPFDILNFGNYENEDTFFLFKLINNGNLILDIGANIGWYSILLSKHFPLSKIHAFEPVPETYNYLIENLKLNEVSNVEPNNLGISDHKAKREIYYCPEGAVIASEKNLVDSQLAKLVECNFTTIDEYVDKNNITSCEAIKCDIEGAELFAVKGAKNTIQKYQPLIFIELFPLWTKQFNYHPDEVISFLHNLGYKCFFANDKKLFQVNSIDNIPQNKEILNFFFLHPEKHQSYIDQY